MKLYVQKRSPSVNSKGLIAFIVSVFLLSNSANAVLGRWIEPERNRAKNASEGALFLQQIGVVGKHSFRVLTVDRVAVAGGFEKPLYVEVQLAIEAVGNANFNVLSFDPSISTQKASTLFQIEEFIPDIGRVILGEWTPGYDSRHRIIIDYVQNGNIFGFKVQMLRTIEQPGYVSDGIVSVVARTQVKEVESKSVFPIRIQHIEAAELSIQIDQRIAKRLRTGSIELVDRATHRLIRIIEPITDTSDFRMYFAGSHLMVEYDSIKLQLTFDSLSGDFLGSQVLPVNAASALNSCKYLFEN